MSTKQYKMNPLTQDRLFDAIVRLVESDIKTLWRAIVGAKKGKL